MNKFWETWKSSTIAMGKMKASGFGVIFLAAVLIVALVV